MTNGDDRWHGEITVRVKTLEETSIDHERRLRHVELRVFALVLVGAFIASFLADIIKGAVGAAMGMR